MYPYSHLSFYQLNIHQSTHSASTSTPIQQSLIHPPIQFPSIYPCNIHLSIHSTSIHPPIQHSCIHPPIQQPSPIPMYMHPLTVQNPSIHLILSAHHPSFNVDLYTRLYMHSTSVCPTHSSKFHPFIHPSIYLFMKTSNVPQLNTVPGQTPEKLQLLSATLGL